MKIDDKGKRVPHIDIGTKIRYIYSPQKKTLQKGGRKKTSTTNDDDDDDEKRDA
jgi:hypothetical protein|tara:strand:+ start:4578 stop:4739 length:162 start_codon:yes stop_codon:yes gene_type:complete